MRKDFVYIHQEKLHEEEDWEIWLKICIKIIN